MMICLSLVRFIVGFVFLILAHVAGLFAVAVALVSTPRSKTSLPPWAWWWDNADDGINGDDGWRKEHCPDYTSFGCRYRWLALRNRAHNFSRHVVGYKVSPGTRYRSWGDPLTGNRPGHSGWYVVTAAGGRAFCFYLIRRWPGTERCLRVYVGWKLLGLPKSDVPRALVLALMPFAKYEVKG